MGREGAPGQLYLPPGFRFYPTDEELVVEYLCKKTAGHPFAVPIIAEVDLYKLDPWDLPDKALFGEKEWYFFSPRDRKYPNGSRPNRAAGTGYWKATGTDKPIYSNGGSHKQLVGVKKALVFYIGKAPKGTKTNWIMHEYRLADAGARAAKRKGSLRLDDWVLCRIYKKSMGAQKAAAAAAAAAARKECNESSSCLDEVLASLPDIDNKLINLPRLNSMNLFMEQKSCNDIEVKDIADNVSRSCAGQPWRNTTTTNTTTTTTTATNNRNNLVNCLMDFGQKADQQYSNGGTDGVVTEVASSRCNYTSPLDIQLNNTSRRNGSINYDFAAALQCRPPRPERQPLMHHHHDSPDEEVQSSFRLHNSEINPIQPSQPPLGFGYDTNQLQNSFNASSQMDPMNMVFDNAFLASLQGSNFLQNRPQ
ncbi:hypothetical protein SUGI_0712620 [Cryptomeria japonica]|nr:hypothetical protein SUGI_0712620 [Cryptomeria japonica]